MNLTPGGNQYTVHVVNLPYTVLAAVAATDSDTYHVFINDALSPALRQQALEHELRHIDGDHLFNDVTPIKLLELEASAETKASSLIPLDLPETRTIPYFTSLEALQAYEESLNRQLQKFKRDGPGTKYL